MKIVLKSKHPKYITHPALKMQTKITEDKIFDVSEEDWNNEGKYIAINVDDIKGVIVKKDLFETLNEKRKNIINNLIKDENNK